MPSVALAMNTFASSFEMLLQSKSCVNLSFKLQTDKTLKVLKLLNPLNFKHLNL